MVLPLIAAFAVSFGILGFFSFVAGILTIIGGVLISFVGTIILMFIGISTVIGTIASAIMMIFTIGYSFQTFIDRFYIENLRKYIQMY
ncbi:hypothetical protein RclHR1_01170011 [Rhizophagus clarus]|uniref:Uncharacterized protein n=1 Tax=Rhizophagus clarus TaxID=94130 RepID=A0A2Z6Q537_9GLOM|nr:hypothetical protein RclHR1_01170011 [Rhizophagus clarus]GES78384.1 hypothetical protein RCL_jg15161.t1 [Rhizophagus clarus]